MTDRLTTNYAKNYCNRTLIVKVIVENVVTCFLGHSVDYAKAFDSVSHSKLIIKLQAYGITGDLLNWVKKTFCVIDISVPESGNAVLVLERSSVEWCRVALLARYCSHCTLMMSIFLLIVQTAVGIALFRCMLMI